MAQNDIAQTLMNVGMSASRLSFEIQFQQIETTFVKRLNAEIEDVVEGASRDREVAEMQKKYDALAEDVSLYKTFQFGNEGNLTRLQELGDVVAEVISLFQTGDTELNAEQAEDINAKVADIVERIGNLSLVSHPDINNGDVVFRLRGLAESFQNYKAEAGPIDAADAENPTNDNRALYDEISNLSNWVATGTSITTNTIEYTSDLLVDAQTLMLSIEADMTEVRTVDSAKVTQEVEALKERYAQLLSAISFSFEVSSGFADYLREGLSQQTTDPGSILNLFA